MATSSTASTLSADLIPAIGDDSLSMALVQPLRLDAGRAMQDGLTVQTGPLWLHVVEVFHGSGLRAGMTLQLPITRVEDASIRGRHGFNQWNNLSLATNSLLILACLPVPPDSCLARAAIEVRSPSAPEISAVRACYTIERARSDRGKALPLVAKALLEGRGLLFYYAIDFAGRRNALGREQGGALLIRAMAHASLTMDARFEIASHLMMRTRHFDAGHKADAVNVGIVTALVGGMLAATDPEQRLDWMRMLAATLLGELSPRRAEADAMRIALLRAAPGLDARKSGEALRAMQSGATGPDQENLAQLSELWRRALNAP